MTKDELPDRFMSKVRGMPNGCWEWQGGKQSEGYGWYYPAVTGRPGLQVYAHRFAYETLHGPIPEGLELDHLCRNPPCCNPTHLEAVTHQEHAQRSEPASRTECPQGHPYSSANTYLRPPNRSGRGCKACRLETKGRWRNKRRAAGERVS